MNIQTIQELSIGTLQMNQPFDKPFSKEEAKHILQLLSKSPSIIKLKHFTREGFDGEIFHYAGIRRKDGSVPKDRRVKRVYTSFIVLGFVNCPRESAEFVRSAKAAGVEVDTSISYLVR